MWTTGQLTKAVTACDLHAKITKRDRCITALCCKDPLILTQVYKARKTSQRKKAEVLHQILLNQGKLFNHFKEAKKKTG